MLEHPSRQFPCPPRAGCFVGHQDAAPADPSCCTRPSLLLPSVASMSLPFGHVLAFLCALLRGHDPFLTGHHVCVPLLSKQICALHEQTGSNAPSSSALGAGAALWVFCCAWSVTNSDAGQFLQRQILTVSLQQEIPHVDFLSEMLIQHHRGL